MSAAQPDFHAATDRLDDARAWVAEFAREHGRPLRVLHVGNVAGNAYLNAKFLRSAGIECHVLSYDYYHPIGTPEWEDGIRRPDWFVQGPLPQCARYLHALLDGRTFSTWLNRHRLRLAAATAEAASNSQGTARLTEPGARKLAWGRRHTAHALSRLHRGLRIALLRIRILRFRLGYVRSYGWNLFLRVFGLRVVSVLRRTGALDATRALAPAHWRSAKHPRTGAHGPARPQERREASRLAIVDAFRRCFPGRADALTPDEVEQWQYNVHHWERLLERYDIVQGYGTDVIRPFVAGKRPYVGYEHGTLRDFTLGDDPTHRLTALAYRSADHVFITNGDCIAYAERLGIERVTPMIHPIDVERHRRDLGDRPQQIRSDLGADVLLVCPLRHDWEIKGTDVHLRALPLILEAVPDRRVVLALFDWGAQVADSVSLVEELGCARATAWLPPLGRDDLIAYLQAADVVLDQMALPHFGATAPQAIAAGTPVISSYDPRSTAWIVAEPAPILPAFSPDEVAAGVVQALDPYWRADYRARAAEWTRVFHSPERIVSDHCMIYRSILRGDQ